MEVDANDSSEIGAEAGDSGESGGDNEPLSTIFFPFGDDIDEEIESSCSDNLMVSNGND